jgi:hypothetical protein
MDEEKPNVHARVLSVTSQNAALLAEKINGELIKDV